MDDPQSYSLRPFLSEAPLIALALSGGVDSAVAGALLKKQGAALVALTLRLREGEGDPTDARRVADALEIPLQIIDQTEAFRRCVVSPFALSYARGETPVPCVGCNRLIKFGALMDAAKACGAFALATGHYVRRVDTPQGARLSAATDVSRDQSYFLFDLSPAQIDFARFPLGEMTKGEVRAFAASLGLPVADKPDSQDICFVPSGDYAALVREMAPESFRPGEILDEGGRMLGRHDGLPHYTVGQRKGLGLSDRTGERNAPLYVLRLDPVHNQVIVGPRARLSQREVFVRDVNWLGPPVPEDGLPVLARLRSAMNLAAARFFREGDGGGRLVFNADIFGAAPGQAGVMYDPAGEIVLGGGWIFKAQELHG